MKKGMVVDRQLVGPTAEAFFEDLWKKGDPWRLESSALDQGSHACQLSMLAGRRYGRALEIGCGAGAFTRLLARLADQVIALDIAPSAIARARSFQIEASAINFRVANIMDFDLVGEGPWDLVVLSETIYYLGWLYSFFDVAWLAAKLFAATSDGGRLLMANTCGGVKDYLLRPWLIRTYRDLFLNVGYRLEAEETLRGTKDGVALEILGSLFAKTQEET